MVVEYGRDVLPLLHCHSFVNVVGFYVSLLSSQPHHIISHCLVVVIRILEDTEAIVPFKIVTGGLHIDPLHVRSGEP